MLKLNERMAELSREFTNSGTWDEENTLTLKCGENIAEKVDRLEEQVDEVERVIKEIARTLSYAVDVRHDSYSYLEEVGIMEEGTRAVVEAVIANIQSEIHAEINDLLYPGSRLEE